MISLPRIAFFAVSITLLSLSSSAPSIFPPHAKDIGSVIAKFISFTFRSSHPPALQQRNHAPIEGSEHQKDLRHISISQVALDTARSPRLPWPLLSALPKHSVFAPILQLRSGLSGHYTALLTPTSHQFTFDPCTESSDCLEPRECIQIDQEGAMRPCNGGLDCRCAPEEFVQCEDTDDCSQAPFTEVCAFTESIPQSCFSREIVEDDPEVYTIVPPMGGFNLDPCVDDESCREPRNCQFEDGNSIAPCAGRDECVCVVPAPCETDDNCVLGEICVAVLPGNMRGCVSASAVSAAAEDTSMLSDDGLNFDPCRQDSNCAGARFCADLLMAQPTDISAPKCTDVSLRCVCSPENLVPCQGSAECTPGEVCSNFVGVSQAICVSEDVVENNEAISQISEETSEAICVDAEALSDISREDLVFSEHAVGRVVCDSHGSCATRGHIVVYEGRAMMMGTYCGIVGCQKRVMYVNSPKYSRRKRIRSRTVGLEYTVFAARWETKVEEQVLTAAVKIGL
eukprot:GFKZ01004347.1.p1 GENE.GFKZ01004347.1~~GFKZ01004347.1.p1  ORF type:complete len:512 (+),score=25.00 GFKZ01004347.1:264-1799(+)